MYFFKRKGSSEKQYTRAFRVKKGCTLWFLLFSSVLASCFPGGIIQEGGFTYNAGYAPSVTPIFASPYQIICYDKKEAKRRENLSLEKKQNLGPPITLLPSKLYTGGCERRGESSVFFLFNVWPVTPPLNPEYAIATAVQEVEGDTMINIRYWHEKHYYSFLGNVVVFKVKGDVIRFQDHKESAKQDTKFKKKKRRRK